MSKHSLVHPSHALSRKPSLHTAHTEFTKSSKGPKLSMLIFKKQSPPYKKMRARQEEQTKDAGSASALSVLLWSFSFAPFPEIANFVNCTSVHLR